VHEKCALAILYLDMTRLTIYILLIALTGCVAYRKYEQQDILEQKRDSKGRLTLKKYRQWISNPSHNKLATITQEFDTLGRVIKEYGLDNPYTYDKNYLIEILYRGSYVYVRNKYIWKQSTFADTAFKYDYSKFDGTLEMFSQNIYPDTSLSHKQIIISLSVKPQSLYYGQFTETFPDKNNSWTSDLFDFEIEAKDIRFDSSRKLILNSIRRKNS
jgi:hypothetical protein